MTDGQFSCEVGVFHDDNGNTIKGKTKLFYINAEQFEVMIHGEPFEAEMIENNAR